MFAMVRAAEGPIDDGFANIGYASWTNAEPHYQLFPGDEIELVVPSAPELNKTLTVSLPPRTKRLIARAARESGLTTSEYVRMAIHRKLWQDAVTESRRVAVPRARARDIFTDEDVFALIS